MELADNPPRPLWRDLSAFDALDESWVDAPPQESPAAQLSSQKQPVASTSKVTLASSTSTSDRAASGGALRERNQNTSLPSAYSTYSKDDNDADGSKRIPIAFDQRFNQSLDSGRMRASRRRGKGQRSSSSGAMTDSELLQPGPSSPSNRMPSHKLPSGSGLLSEKIASASLPSSPSLSQVCLEVGSPARSNRSVSTDSSGAKQGSYPLMPGAGGGERSHGKDPAAQSHAEHRHPSHSHHEEYIEDDPFGSAREEQSISQAAVTAPEVTVIEHSQMASPPHFLKPAWAKKEGKNKARDMFSPLKLERMFEPPSFLVEREKAERAQKEEEESLPDEREEDEDGNEDEEGEGEGKNLSNPPKPYDGVHPNSAALAQSLTPQCNFTFASPLLPAEAAPAAAATPSNTRAPLRLFTLGSRKPDIERIINTPRSNAKTQDARRIVWKMVEEEGRVDREKKRLRLDRIPSASTGVADELDQAEDPPASRAVSSASSRTVSSLIAHRRGANAPTPERAIRAPRGESPRKLLRQFSAANQIDEEIADEQQQQNDENGAEDSIWSDDHVINRHGPSLLSPETSIPRVSVEPPASPSHVGMQSPGVVNDRPGMLRITPGSIKIGEMEQMSNGRMTYDGKTKKWLRVAQIQREDGAGYEGSSAEESSDPFRDFDSLKSDKDLVQKTPPLRLSPAESPQRKGRLTAPATPLAQGGHQGSTPRSILKTSNSLRHGSDHHTPTPANRGNRSISFAENAIPQSKRKRRIEQIADLLEQFGKLAVGIDEEDEGEEAGEEEEGQELGSQSTNDPLLSMATPDESLSSSRSAESIRSAAIAAATRSPWNLTALQAARRKRSDDYLSNASFMTDASFHIAHDRVLQLLTDVAPWTARWVDLRHIDLCGRRVESLVRLDEFLPQLEEALLDDNEISYLTGLPGTLRRLSVARNRLPSTAAFGHLRNVESLDISHNNVDLKALRNLSRLRELRADENGISTLDGLETLHHLEALHLRGNNLVRLSIAEGQWPQLRDLTLSRNKMRELRGLGNLARLRCLNLDHNELEDLDLSPHMPRLKQLRLSGNVTLRTLDVGPASNLRTLYADGCALDQVHNIGSLDKLENLSLRQQMGDTGLHWPAKEIQDVKRLFLSGNAFRAIDLASTNFTQQPGRAPLSATRFFGLVYLELSGCQLTSLPSELADMVPNLRNLNADYNLFESLPSMSSLRRLKRISLVGCRIDQSRALVEALYGCEELESVDVRMNPCSLGLYPPIVMTVAGSRKRGSAFYPPIPAPFMEPSAAKRTNDMIATPSLPLSPGTEELGEKSFFHTRKAPPPTTPRAGRDAQDNEEKDGGAASLLDDDLFAAVDARFVRTLPAHFRLHRLLHRGSLAMACRRLKWLDGLLVDEDEVEQAQDYFQSHAHNHAAAAVGATKYLAHEDPSSDSLVSTDED